MTTILDRPSVNIKLNSETKIYEVNILSDEKYDENGFEEFLQYFKNTWEYIKKEEQIYFLKINIVSNSSENELPLTAFIKLIHVIVQLHDIFCAHMHCCSIISKGAKKWQDAYELVTKLYKHPDQRPIMFTESEEDCKKFFILNQIIKS